MTPSTLIQGNKKAKYSQRQAPSWLGCAHVTQVVPILIPASRSQSRVNDKKKQEGGGKQVQIPRGTGHIVIGGVKGLWLGGWWWSQHQALTFLGDGSGVFTMQVLPHGGRAVLCSVVLSLVLQSSLEIAFAYIVFFRLKSDIVGFVARNEESLLICLVVHLGSVCF